MKEWFFNKSVALVGNAESLFGKHHGKDIDRHDVVCRMNFGINIENISDQGVRTDVWGWGIDKKIKSFFNTVTCKKIICLTNKPTELKIDYRVPKDLLKIIHTDLNFKNPSSGLVFLYYINHCCPKEIHLYGFDWKQTPTWYESFRKDDNFHLWDAEKTLILEKFLTKDNIILI